MNDKIFISKNTIIALLLFSFAILSACWAAIGDQPFMNPLGSTTRAGYYTVTTTTSGTSAPDLLWVANRRTQELTVFGTQNNGTITKLAVADLGRAFQLRRSNTNLNNGNGY